MASASVVTIGGMKYDIQGTKAAVVSIFRLLWRLFEL